MKRIFFLFLNLTIFFILVNWGAPPTTIAGTNKQLINFYGTLYTWTQPEQPIKINNISIDNLFRQIPFYLKPNINNKQQVKKENNRYILKKNPYKSTEINIDLSETSEIVVPKPEKVWVFIPQNQDHTNKYGQLYFIEIVIISNDNKTQSHYLIEKNKLLFCDQINKSGPIEMKVPITAVKKLSIEGYTDRSIENKKTNNIKKL